MPQWLRNGKGEETVAKSTLHSRSRPSFLPSTGGRPTHFLDSCSKWSCSLNGLPRRRLALLWTCVIALGALVVTLLAGRWLERRHIHRLPHSGVGVLVGAFCAGAVRRISQLSRSGIDDDVLKDERFDYDFFMITLLPPIIFEAGFNMDLPPALRNLGLTTFLAFIGTTLSTFKVGGMLRGWAAWALLSDGPLASLVFGSLISATDPVSVLSVFKACTDLCHRLRRVRPQRCGGDRAHAHVARI